MLVDLALRRKLWLREQRSWDSFSIVVIMDVHAVTAVDCESSGLCKTCVSAANHELCRRTYIHEMKRRKARHKSILFSQMNVCR